MNRKIIVFLTTSLMVLGIANVARPAATVTVTNYVKGIFDYQVGGSLDVYTDLYSATNWDWGIKQVGAKLLRWETGIMGSFIRNQGQFYPYRNAWQWDAAAIACNGQGSFSHQADFFKRLKVSVLATFNSSLCEAVAYPDHHLDYDELANYWAGMLNYLVNVKQVPVPFVEIGNEMDMGGGSGMGIYKPDAGLYMNPHLNTPYDNGTITIRTQWTESYGGFDVSRDYKMLWRTVYQAMKAVSPGTMIAGEAGGSLFSQNNLPTLFTGNPRPDLMCVHNYGHVSNCNFRYTIDQSRSYSMYDNNWGAWQSVISSVMQTNYGYGPTNAKMMCSEWDYDAGSTWPCRTSGTWLANYYLAVTSKMANTLGNQPSVMASTFFNVLPICNTDQLLDDQNTISPIGYGMRLLKPFAGLDRRILKTTITSADSQNAGGVLFPRVDCISVKGNSTYQFFLVNESIAQSHVVTLNLLGVALTNKPAFVQMFSTGYSVSNNVPTSTNSVNLVAGSMSITLPILGIATVTILYGGLTVTNYSVAQSMLTNSTSRVIVFNLKAYSGSGSVTNVSLDLTQLGGGWVRMTNLGVASQFRYSFLVSSGLTVGVKTIAITARDNNANLNIGNSLTVTNVLAPSRIVATNIAISPSIISNGWPNIVVFQLKAKDLNGGTITNVNLDLSSIQGSPYSKMTNISGNTLFRFGFLVQAGQTAITQNSIPIIIKSSFFGTSLYGNIYTLTNWPSNIIPGIIEAENYDRGGEGVAFHDWNPADPNPGGHYRTNDGINIVPTDSWHPRGAYAVTKIQPPEWMNYTVKILSTGLYCIQFNLKGVAGSQFHLEFDGVNKTGVWANPPPAANYTNFTVASNVALPAGYHQMKFVCDSGGGSVPINWFEFIYLGPIVGQVSIQSIITNVSLQGISTGGKLIPGSTALIKVVCTNATPGSATGVFAFTRISTNAIYVTNSSLIGLPPGWSAEWSTNKNPVQTFTSLNYSTNRPAVRAVKWVRWKKSSGGPMPMNSTATFYYSVTVR